jgi:hypothetical protein
MTDAGFVTEVSAPERAARDSQADALQVHHINGKGEDAGVVYSEMQARENTSGDLIALQWVVRMSFVNGAR